MLGVGTVGFYANLGGCRSNARVMSKARRLLAPWAVAAHGNVCGPASAERAARSAQANAGEPNDAPRSSKTRSTVSAEKNATACITSGGIDLSNFPGSLGMSSYSGGAHLSTDK